MTIETTVQCDKCGKMLTLPGTMPSEYVNMIQDNGIVLDDGESFGDHRRRCDGTWVAAPPELPADAKQVSGLVAKTESLVLENFVNSISQRAAGINSDIAAFCGSILRQNAVLKGYDPTSERRKTKGALDPNFDYVRRGIDETPRPNTPPLATCYGCGKHAWLRQDGVTLNGSPRFVCAECDISIPSKWQPPKDAPAPASTAPESPPKDAPAPASTAPASTAPESPPALEPPFPGEAPTPEKKS